MRAPVTPPGWTHRWVFAVLVATALCSVLATRVFVSFESRRVKIVKTPIAAVEGRVQVATLQDPRAAGLSAPVAVIAIIRNPGGAPESLSILADGRPVCDVHIPSGDVKRVDCVAADGWVPRADHIVELVGQSSGWTLEFLELATHHGSTTHALPFLILPNVEARYEQPGPAVMAAAWLLICVLLLVPAATDWHPAGVRIHRVVSVGVAGLMASMVVSPWWSPYLVVMPLSTFIKATLVLLASRVWRLSVPVGHGVRWAFRNRPSWQPMASAVAVSVIVAVVYGAVARHAAREFEGNYSGLLRVSESGFDRSPLFTGREEVRDSLVLQPNEGYDAQFYYFAAFDPLMRRFRSSPEQYRAVADAPPYRFGRIGFPWLVRSVAGGRWDRYPAVMVGLVLVGVALSAFVLARLGQEAGGTALWGLMVLGVPGFWQSVRLALPEPLAAAFLLIGYWCVRKQRIPLAIAAFAISLLIRETGLVFLVALVAFGAGAGEGRRGRIWLLSAALPLAVWRVYVASGLWPDWGWAGFFYPSHNLGIPFQGFVGLWFALMRGDYHPAVAELARAAIWFPILIIAVSALSVGLMRVTSRFIGAAFVMYALMALSFTHPNVWGHVGNGQRVSYEMFLMLALASLGARQYSRPRRAAVALCWGGAALFILYGAHDALSIREALMPWN